MGLRFRKSVKIAPGTRVNISKSGISTSTKLGGGMTYRQQVVGGKSNGKRKASTAPFPLRAWWIIVALLLLAAGGTTQATEGAASTASSMGVIGLFMLLVTIGIVIARAVAKSKRKPPEDE